MVNMSYCHWRNTASDLSDCIDAVDDAPSFEQYYSSLSDDEKRSFKNFGVTLTSFYMKWALSLKGLM